MIKNPLLLRTRKSYYFKAFFYAFIAACLIFIPWMLIDHGYFIFYGDYNVQQIPFYRLVNQAVKNGNVLWNFNTDLGVNFIGSYSFYNLGSPFLWLTLPFPSDFVPHLMGPLFILKFSLASLTAYAFIRRFTSNQAALIGGLIYTFSGFAVYNIFFNHFEEAIIFFPLLLLCFELFMVDNRRGYFGFAIALCAISNWNFFVEMVVFCVLYWFIRMMSGAWQLSLRRFGCLLLEAVLGVGVAAFMMLPTYLFILQNPRIHSFLQGWNMLMYPGGDNQGQLYPNIFEVFFFPPDWPAKPVFFTGTNHKWESLAGWLPLFGMVGTFALFKSVKKYWLKTMIIVLFIFACVPVLNSAFYLFNGAYYARWFYMISLMLALATGVAIDKKDANWSWAIKAASVITGLFVVCIGLIPNGNTTLSAFNASVAKGSQTYSFSEWFKSLVADYGLYDHGDSGWPSWIFFWVTCAVAVGSIVFLWKILPLLKNNRTKFFRYATLGVLIVSILYSNYFIGVGKILDQEQRQLIPQILHNYSDMDLPNYNADNFRIDIYDGAMDNTAMYLKKPSIQAFTSNVTGAEFDFYSYISVDRGVASRPDYTHPALRILTSCKWLFEYTGDRSPTFNQNGTTQMPDYSNSTDSADNTNFLNHQINYDIWYNQNYVPYGFTFDNYIDKSDLDSVDASKREYLMLKGLVLDKSAATDDQVSLYSKYMNKLDIGSMASDSTDTLNLQLASDSAALKKNQVITNYKTSNTGFSGTATMPKENLVFFSTPYDKGWSATVDGMPTTVEKVDVGFMAVLVPAGVHSVVFKYYPPGLSRGLLASLFSLILLLSYCFFCKWYYKRNKRETFKSNDDDVYKITDSDYIDSEALTFGEDNINLLDTRVSPVPNTASQKFNVNGQNYTKKDYFNDDFEFIFNSITDHKYDNINKK